MRVVEGNYAAWREEMQAEAVKAAERAAKTAKKPASSSPLPTPQPKADVPAPVAVSAAAVAASPSPATHGMSARDLSKARLRAQGAVEKAERAVHAAEARLGEVESALASSSPKTDLVVLAAEHTRLRADVDAAIAAWEQALAEQDALA